MTMESKESEERGRAIVQTLAAVVEGMVLQSESVPMSYYPRTKFEAFRAPGISIRDYLLRIHKYASCSPECFVLALVYMDRLHQLQNFVLTELNVHRVVITSVVLAAKFFDDHYFNNAYYAKVGGVPCPEMNELEVEYLLLINFSLHVCTDTYARYYNELANHHIFTSVRSASLPVRAHHEQQLHHYVTMDPDREGQLMYVTDVVTVQRPGEYDYDDGYSANERAQTEATGEPAYYHPSSAITPQNHHPPVPAYHHDSSHVAAYNHHPPPHPYPTVYPYDRSYVDSRVDYSSQSAAAASGGFYKHGAGSAGTTVPQGGSTVNGIVYGSNTSRTSGQKRRQSVALGVNA
ncbi:hypothetical protein P43SY_010980 [Pythium insidiosum]|uniref:Cyclin-like protein n=1 Tax=Pythium insidiosum TaxID=114742 RepID=A0AAD5Q6J4_PYTIN|nr:hypothetical protein P43SY_010980 [Pythium insidiosum]